MRATKRKHASSVIAQLLAEPYRFSFIQLVNLLLRALQRHGIGRERALHTVLSFRTSLALSFPASEIEALDVEPATQDPLGALRAGTLQRIRITPAFIGLLGTSGTLPAHDTERIAARKSFGDDASQRELLDVMSTRMIGLFYEASVKYRVEHDLAIGDGDRLLPMLTAMAGARPIPAATTGRPAGQRKQVRQETAAYFAGLLRTRPVSASTVEQVLSSYFDVPIRLEQFVGCWDPIPENRRSTLGVSKPVLGVSAALGVRLWRHDLRARLHVGPLDEAQARNFLPGGAALAALAEMTSLFAVPTLRYELRLLLAPPAVKPLTLSTRTPARQLGWSTFLTATPGVTDRPDVSLMLHLPTPAPAPVTDRGGV
ncbi:type VI secretion system baseplate subunit TssG [Massilia aurea]|uniref:type VI secretion system baseplate subunit TssG n=1 Tax=Massilia aurea TaxID=373040 RepID=UPI003462CD5C